MDMELFQQYECRDQFLSQIEELHAAVVEMKDAFALAQKELVNVQNVDQNLYKEVEFIKSQCSKQSSDTQESLAVIHMEVGLIKETLQSTQLIQQDLQSTVQTLLLERDLLLDELLKNGAISRNIRSRLWDSSSGSQSTNDSGVALLLDKSNIGYQPLDRNAAISAYRESLANGFQKEVIPMKVETPLCLSSGKIRESIFDDYLDLPGPNVNEYLGKMTQLPNELRCEGETHSFNAGHDTNPVVYDSDSSMTLAAAKSLSLTNSLSQQCGIELDEQDKRRQRSGSELKYGHSKRTINPIQKFSDEESLNPGTEKEDKAFKERQRFNVVKELLETERKYCQTLKTIDEKFANPLKRSGVLTLRDINTLFPDEVFELHDKHCILLAQLEERVALWNQNPSIGDLLESFTNKEGSSDVLQLYTSYVNDFPEVLKTFHKLCRNSKEFTQFLRRSLEHPICRGLDLGALLLSIIQRIPQYILLFKKIIKYSDPTDLDYTDLRICLDRLRDYLKRLNDSMEHSFQLVTAQMTDDDISNRHSLQQIQRLSTSSSQSSSRNEENIRTKYKRSKSIPRSQQDTSSGFEPRQKINKSKSHWNMSSNDKELRNNFRESRDYSHYGQIVSLPSHDQTHITKRESRYRQMEESRVLSDFEINSDIGDSSDDVETVNDDNRIFTQNAAKSLPNFNPNYSKSNSFVSEPNLCEGKSCNRFTDLKNTPISTVYSSKDGNNIRLRGDREFNDRNMNSSDICKESQQSKRVSLRTSLKNIFSLKKRTTRTLQISGPILPSRMSLAISAPSPVAKLRFYNNPEGHQSLPPEGIQSISFTEMSGENSMTSLPAQITNRYRKNSGSHLANPKLPKNPFMTKHFAHNSNISTDCPPSKSRLN